MNRFAATTVLLMATSAPPAGAGAPKTTSVKLRASVRVASAPATVILNAELTGGQDGEGIYCPTLEWDWGDGTRSESEGDCEPYAAGTTKVERRFTESHEYRSEGRPTVRLVMRKEDRELGRASVGLVIGPPKAPLSGTYRGE